MQNILTSDHSSYHLHTIYRINAVTKHSVYYASGTPIEDNEIDSVAFCVHCGSKLPKTTEITEPITEDGIILEYYVNAAENELYGNKSQAEEMYYKS